MALHPENLPVEVDLDGGATLCIEQTAYGRRPFCVSVVRMDRSVAIRELDSGDSAQNYVSTFVGSLWVAVFRHDEGVLDILSLPTLESILSHEIDTYPLALSNLRLANFFPLDDGSLLFETETELLMLNHDGSVRWKRESANPAKYVQNVDETGIQFWNQGERISLSLVDGSQTP